MPIVSGPTPPPAKKVTAKKVVPPTDDSKVLSEREDGVNGIFTFAAAISMATGQWADAGAISIHGPNISREAAAISMKYEKVGNALDALANVSPFANIFGAVMPLILQLAANHKRIPAEKAAAFGVKDPALLEGQMRMEAQRQAMEYQKMQIAEQEKLEAEAALLYAQEKASA